MTPQQLKIIRLLCGAILLAVTLLAAPVLLWKGVPFYWASIFHDWGEGADNPLPLLAVRLMYGVLLVSTLITLMLMVLGGLGLLRGRSFGYFATYAAWFFNFFTMLIFVPLAYWVMRWMIPLGLALVAVQVVISGGFMLLVGWVQILSARQSSASEVTAESALREERPAEV